MKTPQRDNDRKVHHTAGGLPEYCWATLPGSPDEVIMIRRGEIGYYPGHGIPGEVDHYNHGLTKAQVEAMKAGSMWGWDVPLADPANYHDDGRPMTATERAARDDTLMESKPTEAEPAAPRSISLRSSPAWLNALSVKKESASVFSIIDAAGDQVGVICLNVLCEDSGIGEHIAQALASFTIEDEEEGERGEG